VNVVDELVAEVKAARRAEAALRRHNARINELFVEVRAQRPDLGPADIEELIGRYRDRATISRRTAPALGLPRRGGRRKKSTPDPSAPAADGA
jgi:hypothetical protein